jgi:hypothetical protein
MIRYVAGPELWPEERHGLHALRRRGLSLGWVLADTRPGMPEAAQIERAWHADEAVMLPGFLKANIEQHGEDIAQARRLMEDTLDEIDVIDLFQAEPYASRLTGHFTLVASVHDEGDRQEIEKLFFDAERDGKVIGEELWCKASWLSYHPDDASLRFRFSYGLEGFEDVAADPQRQQLAAELTDSIFPESAIVAECPQMQALFSRILHTDKVLYGERIVYFNAPDGGAQMHHDVERGHAGVVFAQLSGRTFWLALSKPRLMDEITAFLARPDADAELARVLPKVAERDELRRLAADRALLSEYMERHDHELVEALVDRLPAFTAQLVAGGYAHLLQPGDAILLPQRDLEHCVWHSVFCLGDKAGESLSFAVRPYDQGM